MISPHPLPMVDPSVLIWQRRINIISPSEWVTFLLFSWMSHNHWAPSISLTGAPSHAMPQLPLFPLFPLNLRFNTPSTSSIRLTATRSKLRWITQALALARSCKLFIVQNRNCSHLPILCCFSTQSSILLPNPPLYIIHLPPNMF